VVDAPFMMALPFRKAAQADIGTFVEQHNKNPKHFNLTKPADQILVSVKCFCHKAQENLFRSR
jgi:hypothetical protein